MRRSRVAALAVLSLASFAVAAAAQTPEPRCGGVFGLCGYVDAAGSEVTAADRFEEARPFSKGLAAVRIEGLWGFVRPTGDVAIEPRFQAVDDFRGRRAEVVFENRAGIIDPDGSFVIPPKFGRAIPFTEDVALVSEFDASTSVGMGRPSSNTLFSFESFRLYHRRDGWLTKDRQKFDWFRNPRDGVANLIWAAGPGPDEPYGLMDERGGWVIQPQFGYVQALHDGRAVVRGPKFGDGWGAVDESGLIVIPLKHHWLSFFENGYALLGGTGDYWSRKHGLIRSDGTVVAEPVFDDAKRPEGDGPPLIKRGGIWHKVERDGSLIPSPDHNEPDGSLIASCPQGLTIRKQGTDYVLEAAGGRSFFPQPVSLVEFGTANDDGSISERELSSRKLDCRAPIVVSVGDYRRGTAQSTYVRPDGQPLLDPLRFFSWASRFHLGHAVVGTAQGPEAGERGIIDAEGRFTLPLRPEPVRAHHVPTTLVDAAVFLVGEGDGARLTDARGRPLPEVERALDRARRQQTLTCGGGARITGDGERFGIVGPSGEILVPAIHRAISCFGGGVAWAPRDERRGWCPIGVDGAFRDAPACMRGFYPTFVTHHSPERFSDDPYENSVLWNQARLRYGVGLRDKPPGWIGDGVRSAISSSAVPFRP